MNEHLDPPDDDEHDDDYYIDAYNLMAVEDSRACQRMEDLDAEEEIKATYSEE